MKISLNWLKHCVALDSVSVDEITRAITFLGFEVEGVQHTGLPRLEHVVVGEIRTRDRHPNADKLSVCTVDVGAAEGGVRTIVCGAPNCDPGRRVPVALPGAVLPGNFVIKQSKIRGQQSDGMMCAPDELGLGEEHAGLLILDPAAPIGTPINEVLRESDVILDLEITPNRPDALSHIGIARELAAWFRQEVRYPEIKFRGAPHAPARPDLLAGINVEAPEDCPLYIGIAVSGVKVGPSPAWMQERLKAVGQRPINNLVDIGNYVMLELGQPLHVFDAAKIGGRRIVVRRAREGEKLTTLDGKERALTERMLVIADSAQPLVVAGIMGGANAEVDAGTTDIVLEAAYFRPQSIRATSRQLGLASDSSYRFERGIDPHSTLEAAQRAIDLILESAGGTVVGPIVQTGGDVPWSREIVVTPAYVNERLGFEIPAADQREALEALDLLITHEEPTASRGPAWTVAIPSWRSDLDRPIDLVEEILRMHGTEKVPPAPCQGPALVDGDDDAVAVFNRAAAEYFVGQNFQECVNYTLRPEKEARAWTAAGQAARLALLNPFIEDQSHLRSSLLGGLLESLRLNQSRGNRVAGLFETGRVFAESGGQVFELCGVGFLMVFNPKDRSWLARPEPDFYTAKRHLEVLAGRAGVKLGGPAAEAPGWQPGHSVTLGGVSAGWIAQFGLLDLAQTREAGIEGRVWAGMLGVLPARLATTKERPQYRPVSHFPPALRDIALVADAARPADDVRRELAKVSRAAAGNAFAVEAVEVFDVYRGEGLPAGRKSLAFCLSFRSADRTLTDAEVNEVFGRIQRDIAADGSLTVRS